MGLDRWLGVVFQQDSFARIAEGGRLPLFTRKASTWPKFSKQRDSDRNRAFHRRARSPAVSRQNGPGAAAQKEGRRRAPVASAGKAAASWGRTPRRRFHPQNPVRSTGKCAPPRVGIRMRQPPGRQVILGDVQRGPRGALVLRREAIVTTSPLGSVRSKVNVRLRRDYRLPT